MRFKKGQPRPPNAGRKPGSQNRVSKTVKQAVVEALNEGKGATAFFVRLKNSRTPEDRRTFAYICSRMIPREIEADFTIDHPIGHGTVLVVPSNCRGPGEKLPDELP